LATKGAHYTEARKAVKRFAKTFFQKTIFPRQDNALTIVTSKKPAPKITLCSPGQLLDGPVVIGIATHPNLTEQRRHEKDCGNFSPDDGTGLCL
jgi:hypothetical protein